MIIGMAPMALGLGEGGEQNAPLGRAVIGGLIFATVATLIFVPGRVQRHSPAPRQDGRGRRRRRSSPCRLSLPRRAAQAPRRGLAIAGVAGLPGRGPGRGAAACGTAMPARRSSRNGPTAQSVPVVSVISPATGANKSSLDLPGRLEAYARAPIYARVSGFLKAWYVDIGAPVKAGQLLAEIEAPDLDQQLLQAKAALASAQAGEALAAGDGAALADAGRRPTRWPSRPSTRRPATSRSSRR